MRLIFRLLICSLLPAALLLTPLPVRGDEALWGRLKAGGYVILVLVTHGVNIYALTGISPATAELVIVSPGTALQPVGRITVR